MTTSNEKKCCIQCGPPNYGYCDGCPCHSSEKPDIETKIENGAVVVKDPKGLVDSVWMGGGSEKPVQEVLIEISKHKCETWNDDDDMKEGTAWGRILSAAPAQEKPELLYGNGRVVEPVQEKLDSSSSASNHAESIAPVGEEWEKDYDKITDEIYGYLHQKGHIRLKAFISKLLQAEREKALRCGYIDETDPEKPICQVNKDCHVHDWRQREAVEAERQRIEDAVGEEFLESQTVWSQGFNAGIGVVIKIIRSEA